MRKIAFSLSPLYSPRGFTLMEILVVIGITGILLLMISAIFINIVQSSVNATITNEVRENGQFMMETMVRCIRNADSVIASGQFNSDGTYTTSTLTLTLPANQANIASACGGTGGNVSFYLCGNALYLNGTAPSSQINSSQINGAQFIVDTKLSDGTPLPCGQDGAGKSYFNITPASGMATAKVKIVLSLATLNPGGLNGTHTEYVTNQQLIQRVVEIRKYTR